MPRCVEGTPERFFAEQWCGVPLYWNQTSRRERVNFTFQGRNVDIEEDLTIPSGQCLGIDANSSVEWNREAVG